MIDYLYKYTSFGLCEGEEPERKEEDIRRKSEIIKDSKAWFSTPSDFNDPFDCRCWFSLNGNESEIRDFAEYRANYLFPNLSRSEINSRVNKFVRDCKNNYDGTIKSLKDEFDAGVANIAIYSLSRTSNNILMWSHYADYHRGICLQFRYDVNCSFMGQALDVKYSKEYPVIDIFSDDHIEGAMKGLLWKSDDWEYETEWRIIDTDKGRGHRNFPKSALSGVIFGCKMPEKYRQMVTEWLSCRNTSLYEAIQSDTKYELKIVPLNMK